ncbi:MAG TPA: hypothetical protein VM597_40640 [Gemmataceae bacterium]|jgi:hypothetical protein|nr:hypothetical protein [Gemmataceae bacterium]
MIGSKRSPLRVELLTDRVVPSVTVVQEGTTLTVTGDQQANDIAITDGGTAAGLTVTVDGTDYPVTGDVETILIIGRSGGDTVSYELEEGFAGTTRTIEAELGNGHDTFAANLDVGIDAASWLTFRVNGGNGKDDLSVAGAGDAALAGNLVVELDGGNGKDVLDLSWEGLVTGSIDLTADGGNGVDTITGDVTDAGATASVKALVLGGGGKDDLTLSVVGDAAATVDATIDGGRGRDKVTSTDNVDVLDADAI